MAGDDLAAVVERIRSTWQVFEELPGEADSAYRRGQRYLDDAAEELGDLAQPLRNALDSLKRNIDSALESVRNQLNGPLPVASNVGGGGGGSGGAGGMSGGGGDHGAGGGGAGGAGGTGGGGTGGPGGAGTAAAGGGAGLIDTVLDGYEVLQQMKLWDDEWFSVRNNAFDVGARLKDPDKRLEKYWKGPAADKYYKIVIPQVTAARRVGELADLIGKSLQTMNSAGNTFYYALAAALIAIVGGFLGAIAALIGVFTAPLAVPLIVGALAATAALMYGFVSFTDAQMAEASKLLAEVGNTTGFDAGPSWPQAAASISTDVNPHDRSDVDWIPVNPATP